jgi:hypothetical protein
VADKMSGGSEGVKAEMMSTLTRFAAGEPADVEAMIEHLRAVDSKSDLAWALALVAEIEMRRGQEKAARAHAQEALAAANVVGRASDAVIASAILRSTGGTGGRLPGRADAMNAADLTARACRYLEETTDGHPGSRADV